MRKLESLLAIALVSALSAMAAPAASASTELFDFASSLEHTTVAGSAVGNSQFTFDAGTLSCKSAAYTGTVVESKVAEVALSSTFNECTMAGNTATVTMNGCQIVMTSAGIEGATKEVNESLSCEAEKSVVFGAVVAGVKCTISLPAQTLGHAVISEVTGSDLTVAAELTALEYSQTGTPFKPCQTGGGKTNGTFKHHETLNGGEAALALEPIPQRLKFVQAKILFGKVGETVSFELIGQEDKKVEFQFWVSPKDHVQMQKIKGGCSDGINGTFFAKGETCKEEIKCVKGSINEVLELSFITSPIGGDLIKIEGC
jgi:hypothetical protein